MTQNGIHKMKLPTDSDLNSHFGNIYRELTGGEVDVIGGGEPAVHENGYHHEEGQSHSGHHGRTGPQNFTGQGDFSEFLWMEHEDEYDREVIRELEEEDMINYYFDLYQDSLNPGQATNQAQEFSDAQILGDLLRLYGNGLNPVGSNSGPSMIQRPCGTTPAVAAFGPSPVNGVSHPQQPQPQRNHSNGEDLSSTLGRILTFQSTLNPNAPEFIPRYLNNGNATNGQADKQQTPSSQPPPPGSSF